MGPRNSKNVCANCLIEEQLKDRWKQTDFQDRAVNITVYDNGTVNIYEGKKKKNRWNIFKKNKKGMKGVSMKSEELDICNIEGKENSHTVRIETNVQTANFVESLHSNTSSGSIEEETFEDNNRPLISESYEYCEENTKFQALRGDTDSSSIQSSVAFDNLKESGFIESNEDKRTSIFASDSFMHDVNKKANVCQDMVKDMFDKEKLNNCCSRCASNSSGVSRKSPLGSDLNFKSILSEPRPFYLAEGTDSSNSVRENRNNCSISSNTIQKNHFSVSSHEVCSFLPSFSRSVTGYPDDTSLDTTMTTPHKPYFSSCLSSSSMHDTFSSCSYQIDKKQQIDKKTVQTENCQNLVKTSNRNIVSDNISFDEMNYEQDSALKLCDNFDKMKMQSVHETCKGVTKLVDNKACQTSTENIHGNVNVNSADIWTESNINNMPSLKSASAGGIEPWAYPYGERKFNLKTEAEYYDIIHERREILENIHEQEDIPENIHEQTEIPEYIHEQREISENIHEQTEIPEKTDEQTEVSGIENCGKSACTEEDTESECLTETVEIYQQILESYRLVTIIHRDCSFSAYVDFITLKPVCCATLRYREIMFIDMKELDVNFIEQILSGSKGLKMLKLENKFVKEAAAFKNEYTDLRSNNIESSRDKCSFLYHDDSAVLIENVQAEYEDVAHRNTGQSQNEISGGSDEMNIVKKARVPKGSSKILGQQTNKKSEEKEDTCQLRIQAENELPFHFKEDSGDINKQKKWARHENDMSQKKKKAWKDGAKKLPIRKKINKVSLDSSLEDKECRKINACSYCGENLNEQNRKCKHHKKIRKPVRELTGFESFESYGSFSGSYNSKLLIFRQINPDSGIFSCSSKSSSFRTMLQDKHYHLKRTQVKKEKHVLRKCIFKKYKLKNYFCHGKDHKKINTYRNAIRNACAKEEARTLAKQVAREIHVDHINFQVFGLGSYFDRLNNGPLTTQERMQYEWLRLATFRNYTGNGSAIALARNGFYHDQTEGPTSTRCFLCNFRHSNWERYDDVSVEHRQRSPSCPFHQSNGQQSGNISITSGSTAGGDSAQTASTSAPVVTLTNTTTTATCSSAAAVSEASRSLQRTQISEASSSGAESIPQQPSEDPESRDRSMLALPQTRNQRALGRTGHTYSTIIAPRRNNVATGATSNVGIDPSGNGSSTGSQVPGYRPSAIIGGPVGSGAFSGFGALALNTGSQTSVPRATEGLQGSSAQTSSSEGATGASQTNPTPGAGGRTDPNITVVVDNPKHPDYLNLDSRIGSYEGWPSYLDQTPRQMSEAGFFYVGVADFTRCFCCGGGLRNWEPGDDPLLEHTRWFPRCEYVNKLKGERYVAAVQRRHLEHMAEQQRQQLELAQRRDENRNPPDPMTTDAAAVMREMGYSVERTREAILAVRQQTGSGLVTTQQVLTWLLDDEERRQNGDSDLGVRPPPSAVSSTETTVVGTSIAPSVIFTGTSIASSLVLTGTSVGTSIVNTTSSISTATSVVSAGTTTSTVSSTSTSTTAEVQLSGTPASTTTEGSSSGTENQQTGSVAGSGSSSSSNSASGTSVEKQSGASGGDSDEAKSAAKEGATSTEPKSKAAKKKNAKKKAKNKAGSKSETAGATGEDLDAKSLKAENEKLREMQTCKICMERAVNTTLLPCGHLVCCDSCAARLQRCPICRKRIKGTVKTFMS